MQSLLLVELVAKTVEFLDPLELFFLLFGKLALLNLVLKDVLFNSVILVLDVLHLVQEAYRIFQFGISKSNVSNFKKRWVVFLDCI